MKRLPQHLALAIGSILAALLFGELLARSLLPPPRYHRDPVELDPLLGFRGIPGHRQDLSDEQGPYRVDLNASGMRGRELPAHAAPAGVSRVVFVGDSFLVGQAVRDEQLVTSLVEAGLDSRGRDAEVYNLSVVDYGTAQELLLLRALGRDLEPDAVVLFVYPANDLINNSMELALRTTVSPGDPIRPYLVPEAGRLEVRHLHPLRAFGRNHSRLFATLERRALARLAETSLAESAAERVGRGAAPREDLEIYRLHPDPGERWALAWDATFALLRAFRDECDAMGARLLVVVVPSVDQVIRTPKAMRLDVSARLATGRGLDSTLDWDLPERELGRFLEEERIARRMLLGPLRDAAARGERVYTRDEHLAPRGHEHAAGVVLAWLGGDGEAPGETPPGERRDGPVRILPEASTAQPRLDFRERPHFDHLGDGWLWWEASKPERAGGWLVGPSALAVLPAGAGDDLVLRGWAPEEASYPVTGALAVVGVGQRPFRIERPGRFSVRARGLRIGPRSPASSEGYAAVLIAPGETHRRWGLPAGLFVEELGFEAASVSR
jgi:hypothetical protein